MRHLDPKREGERDLARLLHELERSSVDRRHLLLRAGALGLSAALFPRLGSAQQATPAAGGIGAGTEPGTRSLTHEEARLAIMEAYGLIDPPVQGGQIVVPSSSDFQTLNPALAADATSFQLVENMYEGLVGANPADGTLIPGLCDHWELAEDGVTFTFHLPQNVLWHDGQPFTAEDVRFSYDTVLNPDINNSYRSQVLSVTDSYRVVDEHTFEVKAKERLVTFLADSPALVFLMPRHIWENVPADQWPSDPGSTGEDPARVVGTGPFKYGSRQIGESATLVRNDQYWDVPPAIDEFTVRIVPDTAAEVQALKAGEVDLVELIPFAQVEEIRNTPGLKVETYPTGSFWYYLYNLDPAKTELFQDVRVRQALFYAIDRQAIVDNITFGYAEVAEGTQPKLSIAYAPDRIETKYTYDPERARQLLEEAGWVDADGDGIREKDGQKFQVEWLSIAGINEYQAMLAAIQQWWRDVGVEMTPRFVDFPTILDTQETHEFQIMNLAFSWTPPFWDQGAMFNTASYDGGFNHMKYSNAEFDRLDEEQKRELDPEKRREILIEQANIVNEDLPVGVLLFRDNRVGYSDRLRNYVARNVVGRYYWGLNYVYIEE